MGIVQINCVQVEKLIVYGSEIMS